MDLSEQFLLQCVDGSTCDGGYIEYTMDYVIKSKGAAFETSYPYRPFEDYDQTTICSTIDFTTSAQIRMSRYDITD